eukprot:TRINITY_DN19627_c1_g1_i1.p1 TRINITY_DN19627_c1_g1~~TRINITY_DN19627_c1_g1_i1.p1  ORF type:complete len:243 (-),score=19.90 TRINITY_DN19627_c1_g1_i1:111-839(-)
MLVVTNVAGDSVEVSVARSGKTISDVKQILEESSGVPVEEQRLFIGTEELRNLDLAPAGDASLVRHHQSAHERLGFPEKWRMPNVCRGGNHEMTGNTVSGTRWRFVSSSSSENVDGEGRSNVSLIFGDLGIFYQHEITNLSYTQYSQYRVVDLRGCEETIDLGHLRSFAPCLIHINRVYRYASLLRGHSQRVMQGGIKVAEARFREVAAAENMTLASFCKSLPAALRLPEPAKGWRSLWAQI